MSGKTPKPEHRLEDLRTAVQNLNDRFKELENNAYDRDLTPLADAIKEVTEALPGSDQVLVGTGGRVLSETIVDKMFDYGVECDERLRNTTIELDEKQIRLMAFILAGNVMVLAGRVPTKG